MESGLDMTGLWFPLAPTPIPSPNEARGGHKPCNVLKTSASRIKPDCKPAYRGNDSTLAMLLQTSHYISTGLQIASKFDHALGPEALVDLEVPQPTC